MVRLSAFAAAVAVALLAAPACAQVRWSLPSAYPADNFHSENLDAFAKEVAEATGGKLAIKTYPNASLFPATAIKSAVRIGQAQMGEVLISVHDNEDPMFGIDVVPFLASFGPRRSRRSSADSRRKG
jgi:TRAP-type C4-dicarboxylate transport system substrate-binding protein